MPGKSFPVVELVPKGVSLLQWFLSVVKEIHLLFTAPSVVEDEMDNAVVWVFFFTWHIRKKLSESEIALRRLPHLMTEGTTLP